MNSITDPSDLNERSQLIEKDEVVEEEPDSATRFLSRWLSPRALAWAKLLLGYSMVIFAGLCFTAANVVQKIVAPELNFWHLLLYRAVVQMLFMGALVAYCRTSLVGPRENRFRIFLQGCLGGVLLLCIFVAIKNVPLGNASAIFFCTPVFTFFFAMFMLDEDMGLYRTMISSMMVVGVTFITRPPFFFAVDPVANATDVVIDPNGTDYSEDLGGNDAVFSTTGYICAILVPLLSAIVSILTRQLKHIHAPVLMFWFAAGTFIVACGGIVFTHTGNLFNLDVKDWVCTLGIVLLGIIGNGSYTLAVRWVSPSKANVFRSFEVVLNFVLQVTLEHTLFHMTSIFGILFLLAAVFSTGFESEVMLRFSQRFRYL